MKVTIDAITMAGTRFDVGRTELRDGESLVLRVTAGANMYEYVATAPDLTFRLVACDFDGADNATIDGPDPRRTTSAKTQEKP
jgi:hypothetical protein